MAKVDLLTVCPFCRNVPCDCFDECAICGSPMIDHDDGECPKEALAHQEWMREEFDVD